VSGAGREPAKFNRGQLAAIRLGGNLLVSASAGTGKTAVLVERVIQRILDPVRPIGVDRLLVVTFTDAAAAQMRSRILAALLEQRQAHPGDQHINDQIALLPRADISTLHSWCLRLVQRNFHILGLDPGVGVMDEHEAELLMLEVLDHICEERYEAGDAGFLQLVDAYGNERGDQPVRDLALSLLRYARTQPDPAGWLRSSTSWLEDSAGSGGGAFPAGGSGSGSGCGWWTELVRMAAEELQMAAWQLDQACGLSQQPGGPAAYLPVLTEEADLVGRVAASARELLAGVDTAPEGCRPEAGSFADRWVQLLEQLSALGKLGGLPRATGVDEHHRKAARDQRDRAWRTVAALQQAAAGWEPAQLEKSLRQAAPVVRALVDLVIAVDVAARDARTRAGRVDFADFEYYALRLLRGEGDSAPPSAIALALQDRYVEVLVDEYQDINRAQAEILRLVSRDNLFSVGDVKQSIYRFRGTNPEAFGRLAGRYHAVDVESKPDPEVAPPAACPGRLVAIRHNYRSRAGVLAGINFVFRQLMCREIADIDYSGEHELVAGATVYEKAPETDAPVEVYLLERARPVTGPEPAHEDRPDPPVSTDGASGDEAGGDGSGGLTSESADPLPDAEELEYIEQEAMLIGLRIRRMVAEAEFSVYDTGSRSHRPVSYKDVVILLRAVRGRANRYLEVLARLGVPVRAELATGYFAAIEVETALALLRVIDNPRQDIPLAAVLRSPVVGLSEPQLALVRSHDQRGDFYDALLTYLGKAGEGDPLRGRLEAFMRSLDGWRTDARRGPLGDLVWRLLHDTGYLTFVSGLPGGAQRQANLMALYERAREFDRFSRQGLVRFLRFVERLHEADRDLGAVSDPGQGLDAVLVTTVHKAKGLEFPVVFLPDLGKAFHPPDRSEVLWHADLGLGPRVADRAAGLRYPTAAWTAIDRTLHREAIAEEMRVLYVAMTRARERLVLSGSARKLSDMIGRWCQTALASRVPAEILATRRSFLDWLGSALVRHGDVARQLELTDLAGAAEPGDGSCWRIYQGTAAEVARQLEGVASGAGEAPVEAASEGMLDRIKALQPLTAHRPGSHAGEQLEARLGWQYPHGWRSAVPSRATVSELRRQAVDAESLLGAEYETAHNLAAAAPAGAGFELPHLERWGEAQAGLSPEGAQRGSLVHLVLAQLDLGRPLQRQGIMSQIAELVAGGLAPPAAGELDAKAIEALEWFFGSDEGAALIANRQQVVFELPFTLGLHPGEIWPDLGCGRRDDPPLPASARSSGDTQDELVLVQGIVDCVIRGACGLVLLDFKTDNVTRSGVDRAAAKYARQIEMYSRGLSAALGQPVARAALVFLGPHVIVPVDPATGHAIAPRD